MNTINQNLPINNLGNYLNLVKNIQDSTGTKKQNINSLPGYINQGNLFQNLSHNQTQSSTQNQSYLKINSQELFKTLDKAFQTLETVFKVFEKLIDLFTKTKSDQATQGQSAPASTSSSSEASSPSTSSSSSTSASSSNQFLWKPASDKDGKLAILLPSNISQDSVKSVKILSKDGKKTLAEGKASGVGNGDRAHYRFSKAGSSFPNGSIVEITLTDGSTKEIPIKKTASRNSMKLDQ